jgi:hypothetical protein
LLQIVGHLEDEEIGEEGMVVDNLLEKEVSGEKKGGEGEGLKEKEKQAVVDKGKGKEKKKVDEMEVDGLDSPLTDDYPDFDFNSDDLAAMDLMGL